jgi:hypothetical protein
LIPVRPVGSISAKTVIVVIIVIAVQKRRRNTTNPQPHKKIEVLFRFFRGDEFPVALVTVVNLVYYDRVNAP